MASPLIAKYVFKTGALTTDSTGNSNTLTNSSVNYKYIFGGGGAQFTTAASSTSEVPINFTTSLIGSVMGVMRLDGTPGTNESAYGCRSNSGGDSDRTLMYANPTFTQVRYDTGGTGVTGITIPADVNVTFAYVEDASGGAFYVNGERALTEGGTKAYNNLGHLFLGCRTNNGTPERFIDVTFADLQIFSNGINNAYYKNYYTYTKGCI